MVSRMVVVENMSSAEISLVEAFHLGLPRRHNYLVTLPPRGQVEFLAEEFHERNLDSGRSSAIIPLINGVRAPRSLNPHHFKLYVKITLYVNDKGELVIKGIRPKFTDFGRFWCFGALFGRHYRGREEEEIS